MQARNCVLNIMHHIAADLEAPGFWSFFFVVGYFMILLNHILPLRVCKVVSLLICQQIFSIYFSIFGLYTYTYVYICVYIAIHTHTYICIHIHSFIHSFFDSFIHALIPFLHSIHSSFYSFIPSFIPFIHYFHFIHSFLHHSFISFHSIPFHSFIHPFILCL